MADNVQRRRRTLLRYTDLLIRRGWIVLLCGLSAGGSAYVVAKHQAPVYRATALLVVSQSSSHGDPYTNVLASNEIVQTYLNLIKTAPVIDRAASQVPGVSSGDLKANLRVSNPGISTQIIEIQVDNTQPSRASNLANAVASSFIAVQRQTMPGSDVRVFEPAIPPNSPDHPSPRLYAAVGGLAGAILGLGLLILLELLDDRVRTGADVERVTGLIPLVALKNQPRGRVLVSPKNGPFLPESFRILRTGLGLAARGGPVSTIVVTSAMRGEGKTTVAINLALSLAMAGNRTLLIDADLRNPAIHERLGLPNDNGLASYLRPQDGRVGRDLPYGSLPDLPFPLVLTAGTPPENATELLGSKRMQSLLESILPRGERAGVVDLVVIDTSPAAAFADASVLAATASATLLVVSAKQCREGELLRAVTALGHVKARIAGVVLNQTARADDDSAGYERAAALQRSATPDLDRDGGRVPNASSEPLTKATGWTVER
jgi:polysaccharide biosynthesis transport protein